MVAQDTGEQGADPLPRSTANPTATSNGSLRIAFFTDTYLPSRNGVAVSVDICASGLRGLGDAVLIVAPWAPGAPRQQPGVYRTPSLRWPGVPDYPLAIPWGPDLGRQVRAFDPTVVHAHSPNLLGRVGGWLAHRLGCPLVYTYHTLLHEYARHYTPLAPETAALLFQQVGRRFARQADAVIAPTRRIAYWLEHLGVGKDVHVIPTGVRAPAGWPTRRAVRERWGWRDEEVLLLFVGRLSPEKNIDFLLEGFRRLAGAFPGVRLILVGGGRAALRYRKWVEAAGLGSCVTFVGSVEPEATWDFYVAADVYVSASQTETQGLALGEAMLAGLPCVTVAAYGAAETVQDGVTGFATPPDVQSWALAVARLLGDPNLRRQMGQAGHTVACRTLDPNHCVRQLRAVYLSVLRRRHP